MTSERLSSSAILHIHRDREIGVDTDNDIRFNQK